MTPIPTETVVTIFDEQVTQAPDSIAAIWRSQSLTFSQLQAKSCRLAKRLQAAGVGKLSRVAVVSTRSLDMLIAFYAVLRTGACLVPLDFGNFSLGRIVETLRRVQPTAIVSTVGDAHLPATDVQLIEYSHSSDDGGPVPRVQEQVGETDPIYIIFTSGTTAKPKGIIIPHRAMANYVRSGSKETPFNMQVSKDDRVLLMFSPAFDACLGIIFSTLCSGGQLVLPDVDDTLDIIESCTLLPCTPSLLDTLDPKKSYPHLQSIFLGGEAPPKNLIKTWLAKGVAIYNCYGPTETTVASLISQITVESEVSLGLPMKEATILLVDENGSECEKGEIWISGPGLAQGYYQDEDLTRSKFVQRNGRRYYKTGDHAIRIDSKLFFLGRADSMVKHKGFLINLETEVIPALLEAPYTAAATAFILDEKLVGAVTPASCDILALRQYLTSSHSSFLVPDEILTVETIPLNHSGKTDFSALRTKFLCSFNAPKVGNLLALPPEVSFLRGIVAESLRVSASHLAMEKNFCENGGSSLSALYLVNLLRTNSRDLTIREIFSSNTLTELSGKIRSFEPKLTTRRSLDEAHGWMPLSMVQLKMLTASYQDLSSQWMILTLHFPCSLSDVEVDRLKEAWLFLLGRHDSLNSCFDYNSLRQRFNGEVSMQWETIDAGQKGWLESLRYEKSRLCNAITWNHIVSPHHSFKLVRDRSSQSTLYWLVHHARLDARSAHILISELRIILNDQTLDPSPQFSEAIEGYRSLPLDSDSSSQGFWEQIRQRRLLSSKPFRSQAPAKKGSLESAAELKVSTEFPSTMLMQLCKTHSLTLSAVCMGVWAQVLAIYTGCDNVCFDTVLSSCNLGVIRAEQVVGPLINVVPFPLTVNSASISLGWFDQIQDQMNQMTDRQWHYSCLAQDSYVMENRCDTLVAFQPETRTDSLKPTSIPDPWQLEQHQLTDADFTFLIEDRKDKLRLSILFQAKSEARLSARLLNHVEEIFLSTEEDGLEGRLKLLSCEEIAALTQSDTDLLSTSSFIANNLSTAVSAASIAFADLVALESSQSRLSYAELNKLSETTAANLSRTAKAGDIVCILADGGIEWIVGLLAIVKIGCIYCPIDARNPAARRAELLRSSQANTILVPKSLSFDLKGLQTSGLEILVVGEIWKLRTDFQWKCPAYALNDPICLIHTSGTTGKPNGVLLSSEAILSYIAHEPARLFASPGRRIGQVFAVGFDACLAEVFGTLCYGATLVLKCENNFVTHLQKVDGAMMTPALAASLDPKDFRNLDTVLFGGEVVSQPLSDAWSINRRLYNGYGPSECTIGSVFQQLRPLQKVTLGKPIPAMYAYVLDDQQRLVPVGTPGEIYLGGRQVALGYFNSTEDNDRRFLPDPFRAGKRMFRTGDMGRWNESYELEYIGRMDRQIKINGYRVNLSEVESWILEHISQANQSAVLKFDDIIHIWIEATSGDDQNVQTILESKLPFYVRPLHVHLTKRLPLTANDKVDFSQLEHQLKHQCKANAPSFALQRKQSNSEVARAWVKVLPALARTSKLFEHDIFRDLGGNSILALQIARQLTADLNQVVSVRLILENPTLGQQQRAFDELKAQNITNLISHENVDSKQTQAPLVPQEVFAELYRFWECFTEKSSFNIAILYRIKGDLDPYTLQNAVQLELDKAQIFRSRFVRRPRITRLMDGPRPSVRLTTEHISILELARQANAPFDLLAGPLVRASISKENDSCYQLLFIAHHSIIDRLSLKNLFRDISTCYIDLNSSIFSSHRVGPTRKASGISSPMVSGRIESESRCAKTSRENAKFWSNYLHGAPPPVLSSLQPYQPINNEDGLVSLKFTATEVQQVNKLCKLYSITVQQLFVGCLSLAVNRVFDVSEAIIWIPVSKPHGNDLTDITSMSLDRLPIRIFSTQGNTTRSGFFDSIRKTTEDALRHTIAYHSIRDLVLPPAAGEASQELSAFMVSYQKLDGSALSIPGCLVEVEYLKPKGAKFPFMIEVREFADGMDVIFEYMKASVTNKHAMKLIEYCEWELKVSLKQPRSNLDANLAILPGISQE